MHIQGRFLSACFLIVTSPLVAGVTVYDLSDPEFLVAGGFNGPLTKARCGAGGGITSCSPRTGFGDMAVIRANVGFRMCTHTHAPELGVSRYLD